MAKIQRVHVTLDRAVHRKLKAWARRKDANKARMAISDAIDELVDAGMDYRQHLLEKLAEPQA